jgi:hypothetical protein
VVSRGLLTIHHEHPQSPHIGTNGTLGYKLIAEAYYVGSEIASPTLDAEAWTAEEFRRTYDWMVAWDLIPEDASFPQIVDNRLAV